MEGKNLRILVSIGAIFSICASGCIAYYLTESQARPYVAGQTEKLVIDVDAGADDAMAILLLLSAWKTKDSNFEVVGITCVYGNTYEENVRTNVLKTLTIANASEIPVYGGAQRPFAATDFTAETYFGEDGFGDFVFEEKITAKVDESKHAAMALIELAKKHKGQLSILALAPLTNIGLALALDPNFLKNVNRLYVMGGSVAGMGNKSPGVEYNFGHDPESNFVTFNATKNEPVLLYPWEATHNTKISRNWRLKELGSLSSKYMKFMNKVEKAVLDEPFWTPADVMTAAVMIWPNLVTKKFSTRVTPMMDGAGRGGLLVDYSDLPKDVNAEIIQEINVVEFQRLLIQYLSDQPWAV